MALATGAIALPVLPVLPTPAADGAPAERRPIRRASFAVAAAVAVLIAVLLGGLRLVGVEWFVVTTPSMGTAVPVGALAVDAPVDPDHLAVGDVITFVPPGDGQAVHTHRITAITTAGVSTRGDANAADDPWTLTAPDVRGRVTAVLPGLGWFVRMLPLLLVGGLVTWGATTLLRRPDHRAAAVLLGSSLTLSAASLLFRPLVNAVLLAATSGTRTGAATVVSTGLLPVRVSATGGSHVDLVNGEVGVLRSAVGAGRIDLTVALHLSPLGWSAVVVVCALPLLVPLAASALRRS